MLYIENSNIITLKIEVPPRYESQFAEWKAKLNSAITAHQGFISLEFLYSSQDPSHWIIVQRFSDFSSASDWKISNISQSLLLELKQFIVNQNIEETTIDESMLKGITELIVSEIDPINLTAYRNWIAKIHKAEAKFPGFQGVYIQAPQNQGKYWITLLQFDTKNNLERWLQSDEREKILQESTEFIISTETHKVISPFAGWFSSIAKTGVIPSIWKQTMIVLLVLFPIVMLQLKYMLPLTEGYNMALRTFINNAVSVTLISYPGVPIAEKFLGWWLRTNSKKINTLGIVVLFLLYALEICVFWE